MCLLCSIFAGAYIYTHRAIYLHTWKAVCDANINLSHSNRPSGVKERKNKVQSESMCTPVGLCVWCRTNNIGHRHNKTKPNQINTIPTSRRVLVNRKRDAVYQILNTRFNQIRGVCFSDGLLKNNAKSLQWKLIYRIDRIQVVQYKIQ